MPRFFLHASSFCLYEGSRLGSLRIIFDDKAM